MELARRDELQRGVTEALEKARAALEPSRGSKRKRKKRRKRRLPRSSVPRGGRARRRQRQWLAPGWLSLFFAGLLGIFGIMVGLDQIDSYAARRLAHRRFLQWHVQDWHCWLDTPFPSVVAGPGARHHGRYGPKGFLCRWLVLLVTLHLALYFFPCRPAQDGRHHGRYGPQGQLLGESLAVSCARLVLLVFDTSHCVPPVVLKPMMPCIMASMDQRDSFWARVWQWHAQSWFFWCFCTSRCVPEAYRKIGLFGRWRIFLWSLVSGSHLFELFA